MPDHLNLTPREAADYLRVSQRTLIRWRNQRTGPAWTRCGGKIVYQRADLDAWLDSKRVHPVREGVA